MSGLLVFSILLFVVAGAITYKKNAEKKAELERLKSLPLEEKKLVLAKLQLKMDQFKTNHILHLLLSIFMVGLWIIPWFFIAQSNSTKRKEIESLVNSL